MTIVVLLIFTAVLSGFASYANLMLWKEIKRVPISLSLYSKPYVVDEIGGISNVIKSISNASYVYKNTNNILEIINSHINSDPLLVHLHFMVGFLKNNCLLMKPSAIFSPYIGVNILSNYILQKQNPTEPYQIYTNIISSKTTTVGSYHLEVLNIMITFMVLVLLLQEESEEYATGVRTLQILSGMPTCLYWLTTFFMHGVFYMAFNCLVYSIQWMCSQTQISYRIIMELLNINFLFPLIYTLSMIKITTGITLLMFFLILPQYLYTFMYENEAYYSNYFSWIPGLTKSIACYLNDLKNENYIHSYYDIDDVILVKFMFVQAAIMWFLFICLDNNLCGYLFYQPSDYEITNENENEDVIYEEYGCRRLIEYLKNPKNKNRIRSDLFVHELQKFYSNFNRHDPVIKQISFATEIGTCFGMLGKNSSGKSSLVQMLVGATYSNGGQIYILKQSVTYCNNLSEKIGYCPGSHMLLNNLTGRQMMYIISIIKGIPIRKVRMITNWWMTRVDLFDQGLRKIHYYTPGMRKRLNMAIALAANLPILILDEPTEGVDPAGKGQIRRIISRAQRKNRTVFIASQSIDETEALCDKYAILLNGKIECIGYAEYLMSKYSKGYKVKLKLLPIDVYDPAIIANDIPDEFQCEILKKNKDIITFLVRNKEIKLSRIFEVFDSIQNDNPQITEININVSTLEDLIIMSDENEK